ncbi:MAG: hypothetical protein M1127_00560 [Patescibacteria group bacterium]|nr:hypothetical protein [Patescibacteria group bacterium]
MHSKGLLATIIIIIAIAVVVVILWRGGFLWKGAEETMPVSPTSTEGAVMPPAEDEGQTNGGAGGQTTAVTGGDTGKVTDDIYVEILAQSSTLQVQTDPKGWAAHMKDLYAQYGITEENIRAYGEELAKDPQRAQEVSQRYMQRALELRQAGQ